jgi:hypothetical protein
VYWPNSDIPKYPKYELAKTSKINFRRKVSREVDEFKRKRINGRRESENRRIDDGLHVREQLILVARTYSNHDVDIISFDVRRQR